MAVRWTVLLAALASIGVWGLCATAVLQAPGALNLRPPWPEPPPSPPGPPLAQRRVMLVVVDGLTREMAKQVPELVALAREGASADVIADPPTFSAAQYVSLLSGVTPLHSGVRTNARLAPAGLDSVLHALGGPRDTVIVSDDTDWWTRLYPGTARMVVALPEPLLPAARRALGGARLALVHPVTVDSAGHAEGAASERYRRAALEAGQTVAALWRQFQGPDASLLIVSDHGHTPSGGHGGEEPEVRQSWLVAAGAGVRPGVTLPEVRTVDVAPTLAALLGVRAPAFAEGRALTELLALEPTAREQLEARDSARREGVARAVAGWKQAEASALSLARLGRAALAVLLAAALARWARPRRVLVGGWVHGVLALGLAFAGFTLVTGAPSFSAAPTTQLLAVRLAFAGSGAGLLLLGVSAALARRRAPREPHVAAVHALGAVLGAASLMLGLGILEGLFTPRLHAAPGWLAVLPLYASALAVGAGAPSMLRALAAALAAQVSPRAGRRHQRISG